MTGSISVRNIEGIGPALEDRLQGMGIYSVFDLIRASPAQIHQVVSDRVSFEQVQGWRSMAVFMQIEGMTNQWAEALVKGEVRSIEAFVQRSHEELSEIFRSAAATGLIPEAPPEARLYEMRIDAMCFHHTGSLNGTIRDPDGGPLAGVDVRIGGEKAITDERGRFRINRVQLGTPQRLIMKLPDYETLLIDDPPLTLHENQIGVSVYTMAVKDDDAAGSTRLSEYSGDVLPEFTDFSMSSEQRSHTELREGDILVLHRYYANGKDAQLTSKFLEYEEGTFYAVSFRVPITALPAESVVKEAFIYKQGTFERTHLNANRLNYFKRLRQIRKSRFGIPRPQTLMEFDQAIADISRRLKQDEEV